MAVDEGLRDTLLARVKRIREQKREELGSAREKLREVLLEDQAQAGLTSAETELLAAMNVLDTTTADEARAKRDKLIAELDALQNFIAALQGLV